MNFSPVTHCIFDFDGLLMDSERLYFEVIDDVLKDFGHQYSLDLRLKVLGRTRNDCANTIINHCNLGITTEDFLDRMESRCEQILPSCQLMPGAERLVRHLVKHRIPVAVGTSSSLESIRLKVKNHAAFMSLFSHLTSGTDDPNVKAGKPSPDVFIVCAQQFDPPLVDAEARRRVLVFEDAPNGVRAALAANMQVDIGFYNTPSLI